MSRATMLSKIGSKFSSRENYWAWQKPLGRVLDSSELAGVFVADKNDKQALDWIYDSLVISASPNDFVFGIFRVTWVIQQKQQFDNLLSWKLSLGVRETAPTDRWIIKKLFENVYIQN